MSNYEELMKFIDELPNIYIEDDSIVLDIDYRYAIQLDRCSTPEAIFGWICHLSTKDWVTPLVITLFVEKATEYHGIEIKRDM